MEAADWPGPLRQLVQAHGEAKVWQVGLDALGFPPTWAACMNEFRTVGAAVATAATH